MPVNPAAAEFVSLLGKAPAPAPLNVKVLSVETLDTHTRKLVEYGTVGEERVQAYLLIPTEVRGKLPGILAIHQDGGQRPYQYGKGEPAGVAGDPELKYGLELCERGYVVICPDRFPFESRMLAKSRFKQTFDEFKITGHLPSGIELDLTEDLYQGCVANRLLFEGWTALGKTMFELQRALDVLCEQPEVDQERIGAIGHSAGGLYSALVMYVDPRIKAGCASCGTALIRWMYGAEQLRPINGLVGSLAVPGLKEWGDVNDVLAGLAPRPFLETRGDVDYFSTSEVEELTDKARARYAELGAADRYDYVGYDGGHVFRKDMRVRSYEWFDRWLASP